MKKWPLWIRLITMPIRMIVLILGSFVGVCLILAGEEQKANSMMDAILDYGNKW